MTVIRNVSVKIMMENLHHEKLMSSHKFCCGSQLMDQHHPIILWHVYPNSKPDYAHAHIHRFAPPTRHKHGALKFVMLCPDQRDCTSTIVRWGKIWRNVQFALWPNSQQASVQRIFSFVHDYLNNRNFKVKFGW